MIYTGLNRTGEIESVKAHGGGDVAEVYGSINEANPIYYKTRTITGQTPLSYKALSNPLSDYLISGNTRQNGVPSPDNPVDVVGCGERTENLLNQDAHGWERNYCINDDGRIKGNEFFDVSPYIEILPEKVYTLVDRNNGSEACNAFYDADKNFISSFIAYGQKLYTATSPPNAKYIRCSVLALNRYPNSARNAMLIEGNTEPPAFIPYGYKLPPTVNGTEYPIYLGQVPTTRRIKKLVLTGEDNFGGQNISSADPSFARFSKIFQFGSITSTTAILYASTHFIGLKSFGTSSSTAENCFEMRFSNGTTTIMIVTNAATDATSFNQWLSDQYAAGTPVTIWYVLATEETGIVNEPLHKISTYADTISMEQAGVTIPTVAGANTLTIDTTVQPSAVSITGNIKEVSR